MLINSNFSLYHDVFKRYELCSMKSGLNVSAKCIGPHQPVQAEMGRNLFFFNFSVCQATIIRHDPVGYSTKWIFMDP